MSQKVEKVHNSLDPPSPRMIWTFLNLGKFWNLTTPPLVPNLGKIWNWEKVEFSEPPLKTWNISLKHLKLPKNHFKTNLFFLQLEHLSLHLHFGQTWKSWIPPLLSKVDILHCGLFDFWHRPLPSSPVGLFYTILWHCILWVMMPTSCNCVVIFFQ